MRACASGNFNKQVILCDDTKDFLNYTILL